MIIHSLDLSICTARHTLAVDAMKHANNRMRESPLRNLKLDGYFNSAQWSANKWLDSYFESIERALENAST